MALTKVTGQVIKNTTDVTVGVLTVTNTLAVGGTVSIGGTLTYEDVTNVDAVGLVTARNGIVVGSGITLSKDGDGFFTGVTTATTFVGALTGNVTGNVTGNISGGTVAGSTGTFTGDVDIADKIIHTGDTDTAIRFPAADTFTVETGGSERLRVDSTGNTLIYGAIRKDNISSSLAISGGNAADSSANIVLHGSSGSPANVTQFRTGSTERARITSAGNFGVGTASPDELLHVSGNSSGAITAKIENIYSSDATRFAILELKSGVGSIRFHDQGDTLEGEIKYDSTTNSMRFHTNSNTERLRIDSSGRLGIQGAATKGVLDVRASGGSATMLTAVFGANEGQTGGTLSDNADKGGRVGLYHYDTDEEPFGLFSYGASNGSNSLNFGGGTSLMNAATSLGFFTAANSTTTTGTKRMDINSSGDVTINTGHLIMGTDGKGISFAATGNGGTGGSQDEIFDDYEEGSWNVTALNYDYDGNQAQRGRYVKIGRVVFAFYRIKFHTQTNYTGQHLRFTALPFTAISGGTDDVGVAFHAHEYSTKEFNIYVQPGSTYAYFYTTTGSNYNNSTSLNSADLRGCIAYRASY